jgi:hypothetical protein
MDWVLNLEEEEREDMAFFDLVTSSPPVYGVRYAVQAHGTLASRPYQVQLP